MKAAPPGQFVRRLIRAAGLDVQLYQEVESDPDATRQAMGVVILSSISGGLGGLGTDGRGFLLAAAAALLGWYLWALVSGFIGMKILPLPQTRVTQSALLRTLGFASAPGILRSVTWLFPFSATLDQAVHIWMLAALVLAIRQALAYPHTWAGTLRATAVCLLGWAVQYSLARLVLLTAAVFGLT